MPYNEKSISLIQLSSYVKPDIKEDSYDDWVLNGDNNCFYDYIVDRYNGSPTNRIVIDTFSQLYYGKGISVNGTGEIYKELAEIFPKREQKKCLKDLKMFGEYAMQILRGSGGAGKVAKILHIPVNKLAPNKKNNKGQIKSYWYCEDWSNQYDYQPKKYNAFDVTEKGLKHSISIKCVKPYTSGKNYFSDPNYLPILQYAHLEEEISNFFINHIQNGLSFGYIINMNNGGDLTDEQKGEIEKKIKHKLTGTTNAGKFIISFNDSKDSEVTIVPLEVNDAHNQWEFLVAEAKQQIITGHGAYTNLFGIPTSNGLSSNADELDVQSRMLQDYQIKPNQELFLDELASILEINGLETDLYFIPLRDTYKSTEDTEEIIVEDNSVDEEEAEVKEDSISMNTHVCMSDEGEATIDLADHLIMFGEDLSEKDWYLLCKNEVDYETDDLIFESIKLATSTGTARPNASSEQDNDDIIIRYRYVGNPTPQREFCRKMMFANKLYRKEDILQMERTGVNDGFGLNGTNTYSIWKWKGGGKISSKFPNGTCKHKWQREIYLKRGGSVDVNSPLAQRISNQNARTLYTVPNNEREVGLTPNQNKG